MNYIASSCSHGGEPRATRQLRIPGAGLLPRPGTTPMGMSEDFTESNPLSANSGNSFLHIPSYLKSSASAEQISCPHLRKSETRQQKLAGASAHRPEPAAASQLGQKRLALFAADQAQLSSVQVWVARVLASRVWAAPS